MPTITVERRPRALLPAKSSIALLVALIALVIMALLSYSALEARSQAAQAIQETTEIRAQIYAAFSVMQDAETSQRGYLLTNNERYLDPYERAIVELPLALRDLRVAFAADDDSQRGIDRFEAVAKQKFDELGGTIAKQRAGDARGALAVVSSDRGKQLMDAIRGTVKELTDEQDRRFTAHQATWEAVVQRSTYVTFGGAAVLLVMLLLFGVFASRDYRAVQAEGWTRRVQLALGSQLQGDPDLGSLGDKVLRVLAANLDARVGAAYVAEPEGLKRVAGFALPADAPGALVARGEGLVGQAAKDHLLVEVSDVPRDYARITSATGEARPRALVLLPVVVDGGVQGVIELGLLDELDPVERSALERAGEVIATSIRAARDRTRLEELLHETQRQAEALQTQQEELRVTNEELEQQSRSLQLSQTELENQQSELEQINGQLEVQTQGLERQRDELARAGAELQRANEYKSQFLANMSHELRTPLNSTLILAKLLAENRERNLNEEQIQFARTIYAAGNDLLILINDILDLSKIEAGMLDVRAEPLQLERLGEDLRSTFLPIANDRQLALEVAIDPAAPRVIETDPTRLNQILKNLLSNALKFTDTGGVTLAVSAVGDQVRFAVADTGSGIPRDQHEMIFEAFRQADGGATRKHGGTGLGLSISRDLAQLLGGDLTVESAPGRGSTFVLQLPVKLPDGGGRAPAPAVAAPTARPAAPALRAAPIPDDRDRAKQGARSLMIVEDDLAFARVLAGLARELGYLAIAADTGDDALALARLHQPSAIILDVGLPDRSGLAVLEALKRDSRTRHMPVHVVSAHDYTRTALEMGAVGYAIKPVEREQLIDAIKHLEEKFTQRMRRVLIVEDDPLLRDSTARLLAADNVETVVAGTTQEALAQLARQTFDCMVLDLSLPDRSGLDLLEEMSQSDRHSFPPVIVYTGRKLSTEQVHQLERFSRSIIIKGARSPERLLDEVTLFLHQVEAELPPERQHMLRDVRDRESLFEGRRVLVVEDDVRNVFALSSVLQPRGATVEVARNGREALEVLDKHPDVDLVLMDIMMPEMDGLEAMRRVRAQPRFAKLPIIALTAKAMIDDREKCIEAGANDYIAKPLDIDKLMSLARVWIRK